MAREFRISQATAWRILHNEGLHDSAPAHFTNAVHAYLSRKFGGQWTGLSRLAFRPPG